jgi:hypothetical protein
MRAIKGVTFAGVMGVMCVVAGTAQAADGVLLVQKTTTGGGAPQTHQIQIDGTRMRAESSDASGANRVMVFDGTKQVMTIIDSDKKTYSEMTKDDDRMGGQMTAAMAQMQEQMKNMPPDQRARIEAMMQGRGMGAPAAAAPKTQYKRVGTDTVGKWTCDKYDGYEGEQKVSEVCTVDPKALGLAASDFEVTRQMAAFFQKMMPQMGAQMFKIGSAEDQGFSGIPVRQHMTVAGREVTTEITEVSRQRFADSVFKVPEGYQKTSFMGGRR